MDLDPDDNGIKGQIIIFGRDEKTLAVISNDLNSFLDFVLQNIDKTFIGFFNVTNLKKPDNYKVTTPETWAETLKSISILRNCLVHGTTTYPKDLAEISKKPHGLGFNFTEGEKIELNTNHLMAIELFADQLLNAINLSLVEFGNKNYG
jgi:hypothetical protein